MPPILLLGVALGAAFLLKKPAPRAKSTPEAMVDSSEASSPNAANALFQVTNAIASNDPALIRKTADAIETGLKMPKTAGNLRAWATMVQGSSSSVSGEDETGASGRRTEPLPEWLRFHATVSKLSGDPSHIRATAETLKRFGYRKAAEIHLQQLEG